MNRRGATLPKTKKKTKTVKAAKPQQRSAPETLIQNCTFTGSDSAGVVALAEALKANAEAIRALCDSVRSASPLLTILDGRPVTGGPR